MTRRFTITDLLTAKAKVEQAKGTPGELEAKVDALGIIAGVALESLQEMEGELEILEARLAVLEKGAGN